MSRHLGSRSFERSAVWAFVPVAVMVPFTLLALLVIWLPVGLLTDVRYWWVLVGFLLAGLPLFYRPFQVRVLTPLVGARRPTPEEAQLIEPLWWQVAQANDLPPKRYVVRVLPSDELNAFACGGHLLVVTTFALSELDQRQLRGVLAHELSHHLGLHTVALTIGQWLSVPVVLLARVGFFLQNVAQAATSTFGERSPVIQFISSVLAVLLQGFSLIFTAALTGADALTNLVGHSSEFEADQRVVKMGFGRELASALRLVLALGDSGRPIGWRARVAASHPPARTRVARIEALLRHPAR